MTHAVYAYTPLSIRSLGRLLQHESMGEEARFRVFMATHLSVIATGKQINERYAARYSDEVEAAHVNPFKHLIPPAQAHEGQMIIKHLLGGDTA